MGGPVAAVPGLCSCRGIRTCRLCEGSTVKLARTDEAVSSSLHQCHNCGKTGSIDDCPGDDFQSPLHACSGPPCDSATVLQVSSLHTAAGALFEGVTVIKEFLSQEEEAAILSAIDVHSWADSQSGRKKQDFGPKVNFKRRKLKLGSFSGLPQFIAPLVERMREQVDILADFTPVELCNLDYHPKRGAHIEAHCDDSWLWGERLVTLNLLSPTLLTFTYPLTPTSQNPHPPQDTLHPTPHPPQDTLRPTPHTPPDTLHPTPHPPQDTLYPSPSLPNTTCVHIPLPSRSLIVVCGPARHLWLHSILREHIIDRRVGITLRELSEEFSEGGISEGIGQSILEIAQRFNGEPTNFS